MKNYSECLKSADRRPLGCGWAGHNRRRSWWRVILLAFGVIL